VVVDNGVEVFRTVQSVMALTLTCLVASSSVGLAAPPENNLAAARAAYIATEYEEALKILSAPADGSLADQTDVYRALCLLALGRMSEVDRVLRSIATRNPSFRMSETEVTPRMIAMYDDVRRSTVEGMARDAYAEAKTHFDAGRFAEASARFGSVIALLGPGDRPHGEDSSADDLLQLAHGFKDLADSEVARARRTTVDTLATAAVSSAPTTAAVIAPKPETIIEGVVQRYALAYSALDARAVTRVFPAESSGSLQYAFSKLKAQTIHARDVAITLDPNGQAATVSMVWAVEAVPKVGSTVRAQRLTTLRMARTPAGDWNIVERR
jgi:hypothetical protein